MKTIIDVKIPGPGQNDGEYIHLQHEHPHLDKIRWLNFELWCNWVRYMYNQSIVHEDESCTLTDHDYERWLRQLSTPYEELSFDEKNSDREIARSYFAIAEIVHPPNDKFEEMSALVHE